MDYNPKTPLWRVQICKLVDEGRDFIERLERDPYSFIPSSSPNLANHQTRVDFQMEVHTWHQKIPEDLKGIYEDSSILQFYYPQIEEIEIEDPNGKQEIDYFKGPLKESISKIVEALNRLVIETERAVGLEPGGCP